MPFVLNEEQGMLRDSTRDFLRDHANTSHFRALRDSDHANTADDVTWSRMAELGLSAIPIPEAYGGLEFGYRALGSVFEECGKQLTASPLLSSVVLAASLIELAGNEQQKSQLLAAIASAEKTVAVAMQEGSHHQPFTVQLNAEPNNAGFLVNGRKRFVIDGTNADILLLLARSSGAAGEREGLSLFVLNGDTPGVQRKQAKTIDSRDYADIEFTNVELEVDNLLGVEGQAAEALEAALDRATVCLSAEMLGGAQALFDKTVEYLRDREQFGVKIGSFQALQHRAAKMYLELELTRSAVLDALSAIDEQRITTAQAASIAKCRANDTYQLIANEAVQMHGGIGVTDELDVGLFFKRCRVAIQLLGNSGFHNDRFAQLNDF